MFPKCYNCFNPYHRVPIMPQFQYTDSTPYPMEGQPPSQMQPTQTPTPTTTPAPSDFETAPGAPITQDVMYTQGYLRTQIGKRVKIFFLIGANLVQDRDGILTNVGISYVILKDSETNANILCDIYSIKFVNIYT